MKTDPTYMSICQDSNIPDDYVILWHPPTYDGFVSTHPNSPYQDDEFYITVGKAREDLRRRGLM